MCLVPTGRHITPIGYCIVDVHGPGRAVTQGECAISDFSTAAILLDMVPITEGIFVFDLSCVLAREGDCPVSGIETRKDDTARIPLWQSTIESIKRTGDVNTPSGGVSGSGDSHPEDQGHGAEIGRCEDLC
jgi:hypothetical protein